MSAPEHSPESVVSIRTVFDPTGVTAAPGVISKLSPDDRVRLRRILSEPIEYLDDASFHETGAERRLFADAAVVVDAHRKWCNAAETVQPMDNSALPAATLSTANERKLFLRLNYSRYRLVRILKEHASKRLSARTVSEILGWHAQAMTARCDIVQANIPLVLAMAKRTRLGGVDYAELISEGNMALLRSVDKFDCGRGFKFSTYACRAILKSFSRVAMRSSRYRGRFPTEFDPTLERSDHLDRQRTEAEMDSVDELRSILKKNSADLNEVEAKVLQARFALGAVQDCEGDGPKTLEQVGLLIGVTKERVRQIQNRALQKLRTKLQEDFLAA